MASEESLIEMTKRSVLTIVVGLLAVVALEYVIYLPTPNTSEERLWFAFTFSMAIALVISFFYLMIMEWLMRAINWHRSNAQEN